MPITRKPATRGGGRESLVVPVVRRLLKRAPTLSANDIGEIPDLCVQLIGIAYAAIDAPEQWTELAYGFGELLEAEQVKILIEDPARPDARIIGATSLEHVNEYLAKYRDMDPFCDDRALARSRHTRHCHLSHELIDDRILRESPFYTDHWQHWGNLFWACGGQYELENGVTANVTAMRDKAYGSFEEHERQLGNVVMPHILRAAQLSMRLGSMRARVERQTGIVDNLLDAVMVLDADDRILSLNERARSLLNGVAPEAAFSQRALRLDGASELQRLHDAITRARTNKHTPQLLSLRRVPPISALNIIIFSDPTQSGHVRIFLRDPNWPQPPTGEILSAIFGFTPAQAQICLHLLRDERPEKIAEELGVTVNTVRAQIKAAMQKAGTHRIAQLVHQLAIALPATEATHDGLPNDLRNAR
jgi:DNA-binding CsgD family transcriptional regulator